ncbi:MAG TPA: TolC family outer membrane protein [Hyphomicrobiales bacterium]|nr:TolC family outer membrane protein [Hyphomicrobiales bacterium]
MKRPHFPGLRSAALILAFAGASHVALADNLLEVFELAADNDPTVREARAQYGVAHTSVLEGVAGLLPQVTVNGSSARNTRASRERHSFANGFNTHNYSVVLSQSLVNFQAWYAFQAAREQDSQGLATLALAEQQLIVRVATAYFDVLRSQNNLTLLRGQENAAQQVMDQAQQRYDLGFAEIADVYDSQAAYSQARVNRMDEENILRQRIQALEVITGSPHQMLETLSEEFPVVSADPVNLNEWLRLTRENNLNVRAANHLLAANQNQARAAKAAMLPTLSINARYTDNAEQANTYGSALPTEASLNTMISLDVSVPLFRGGANRARMQRAYYTVDANREALERTERQSEALTRNSFNSIETAVMTVQARLENITIAQNALEATEVGMEVGTRNVVDLVQAQRTLFQAQRDYANARYDYVLNTLTLKQAAGTLNPQDVVDLNDWLVP